MSANTLPAELHNLQPEIVDPGNAGTIYVNRSFCVCNLVSTGAETRTLGRPTKAGAKVKLHFRTDGGDITLTVTGGYDENGSTTFTFSDPGQFAEFASFYDGTNYFWRLTSSYVNGNMAQLTATVTELNRLDDDNGVLSTTAGTGITGGTGTIIKTSVLKVGALFITRIYIDITGLDAIATDGDVIGTGANPAYLGRITAARNGTIDAIRMTCLELPVAASLDIDLFTANVATGKLDDAAGGLTGGAALITAGGNWANGTVKGGTAMPAANDYLYLANGAGANAGTYTGGKFLIELFGY